MGGGDGVNGLAVRHIVCGMRRCGGTQRLNTAVLNRMWGHVCLWYGLGWDGAGWGCAVTWQEGVMLYGNCAVLWDR
jgi:hypothetical protein